jgi:hypothetical protein
MKKLMLMPLLAGVIWVCHASPISVSEMSYQATFSQLKIDQSLLKAIFTKAVPLFKDQYGIVTTVAELQIGYDNGTVTVEKIAGENSWKVTYGGSLIVTLGDYF